jgi:hypothetical protein
MKKDSNPLGIIQVGAGALNSPGTLGNVQSFAYPVVYRQIPAIPFTSLDQESAATAVKALRSAVDALLAAGCKAVMSNCSYSVLFQQQIAAATIRPVMLSTVSLLATIFATIPADAQVALLTSDTRSYRRSYLTAACTETQADRVVVIGGNEIPAAHSYLTGNGLDYQALSRDLPVHFTALRHEHRNLAAVLIACPGFAPFSQSLRQATSLPVYDAFTLANFLMDVA